ncbi:putative flavocytochrome c protein [Zalerion maritima]|uniref:Fumarate reductase n=1 Tax=Zalerion maritima TaxID=339359 RepID=A0AAD5RM52_9PEZI|nr:putative flavocytochrome c protein [Zalerion maritima]
MSRRRILTLIFFSLLIALSAVWFHTITESIGSLLFSSPRPPKDITMTTTSAAASSDRAVLVIGAGLAGLSAATEALRRNVPVRLLDRAPKPGGNSIKASSGINGAPTRFQKMPEDTTFFSDTVKSAGQSMKMATAAREAQIAALTNQSKSAVEWLVDDQGVDLSVVAQLGGHSNARTHRGSGQTPPGAAIVTAMLKNLKENPQFKLFTDCEVTSLVQDTPGGKVSGVEATLAEEVGEGDAKTKVAKQITFTGPVVFAAGGFGGDTNGLLAKYRPDLAGIPSTNDPRPGAHGILTKVGAKLVDMDKVQIHPTGFVDPANQLSGLKFLAAEVLRGEGGILLYEGKRFVNEMETREFISNVVMKLPQKDSGEARQWDVQLLLDPGACDKAASHVGFYVWKGLVSKKKISDLDETTRQSIQDYAAVVNGERKDEFGRSIFGHWRLKGTNDEDSQEVCVGRVTPIVHFTMGGAVIDETGRVLANEMGEEEKKYIEGLWGAGEITGGLHGDNRLGGSSLLECVVFGRQAGQHAAEYLSAAQ